MTEITYALEDIRHPIDVRTTSDRRPLVKRVIRAVKAALRRKPKHRPTK